MAWSLGTWLGVCLLVSASAVVPPPENLHMHSLNFKNILRWESPAFPRGNLTFTVQYHSYYKSFQDQCSHINSTECDFSSLSKYGNYTLRVRAEFQAEHSEWVTTIFCPVDDTVIGPPGLKLKALANSLHVLFLVPRVENEPDSWSMKNFYNDWAYNLEYWKNGSNEKFLVNCKYDSEVLKGLEPWTTYCVRVQAFLPNWNKTGLWSPPACEQTKDKTSVSWIIALVIIGASVCVALLLLGCFALLWYIYKKTKYAFSPGNPLPQHLKEFLGYPHSPLLFFTFTPSDESEVFDKLSVVMSSVPVPASGPSPAEPSEEDTQARGHHTDPLLISTPEPNQTHMRTETT